MVISSQYQGKFIIFCMIHLIMIQLINVCYVFSVLSLKITSATRLYANLDIPEARKLIDMHHGEESVPNIIHIFRRMQATMEEQNEIYIFM
jgi:hypothetical protein